MCAVVAAVEAPSAFAPFGSEVDCVSGGNAGALDAAAAAVDVFAAGSGGWDELLRRRAAEPEGAVECRLESWRRSAGKPYPCWARSPGDGGGISFAGELPGETLLADADKPRGRRPMMPESERPNLFEAPGDAGGEARSSTGELTAPPAAAAAAAATLRSCESDDLVSDGVPVSSIAAPGWVFVAKLKLKLSASGGGSQALSTRARAGDSHSGRGSLYSSIYTE